MGLNKDMQDLIDNINRSLIFYIPRGLFNNVRKKHLDELENVGFLNTLFYMNAKGDPKPVNHSTEYVKLLSKDKILKSNVFELLDLKVKLDKNAFHYLIKGYFKELHSNLNFTEAISKEAKNNATNYKPQIQGYLDLQFKQLLTHKKEVTQKFGNWKSEFEHERVVTFIKRIMPQLYQDKEESDVINNSVKLEKEKKNKKQRGKFELPNDIEIDNYLLETVFNVDFSKISDVKT